MEEDDDDDDNNNNNVDLTRRTNERSLRNFQKAMLPPALPTRFFSSLLKIRALNG